jgi:hypothetical protein
MPAGLPTPEEFAPETEYVRDTAVASVVVQVLLVAEQPQFVVEPEQPFQAYVAGEPVHAAVSVSVVFTAGVRLLA